MLKKKSRYIILLILLVFFFCKICISGNKLSWVEAVNASLVKNGRPFRFVGANAVNLVFYDDWGLNVRELLRAAKGKNISVLRVYLNWGWGKDEDYDKIIAVASEYGIYIILVLTDCCCSSDYSGNEKYFQARAPFCNVANDLSKTAFKKRIKEIIERKNSLNGRIYRDDPAIFAWEIASELEYWHFGYADVKKWIAELARYIKSLDRKHLVTIGIAADISEFDKDSELYEMFNVSELDFFSFHFYPLSQTSDFNKEALKDDYAHKIAFRVSKFRSMGKPVIMSESGFNNSADLNFKIKTAPETTNIYNSVFKKSFDAAFLAGASGVMFWGWGVPGEKDIPMWWNKESHSLADKDFCSFLQRYQIPDDNSKPL